MVYGADERSPSAYHVLTRWRKILLLKIIIRSAGRAASAVEAPPSSESTGATATDDVRLCGDGIRSVTFLDEPEALRVIRLRENTHDNHSSNEENPHESTQGGWSGNVAVIRCFLWFGS